MSARTEQLERELRQALAAYDKVEDLLRKKNVEADTLRAELAGAHTQAAAAIRERDEQIDANDALGSVIADFYEQQRQFWKSSEDRPLPEDAAIDAAHPVTTGQHQHYVEAMRLVGARHSKGGLVDLVVWLLHRLAARDAEVPGLSTTPGYTMGDVAKIEAAATGNETKEVES